VSLFTRVQGVSRVQSFVLSGEWVDLRGKEEMMSESNTSFSIEVDSTDKTCPVGQRIGKENLSGRKIPVISCEGACIRGEIARLAANMVAKVEPYRRACHGEMFTAPHSAIAHWTKEAPSVVVIDGCYMRCHYRILSNLIKEDKLTQFDALAIHGKYSDLFDIDSVSEPERKQVARRVANKVLSVLENEEVS